MAEMNKNSEQELEQVKNAETIQEIIEFILHAEWAESVRESMAKGIEISDGVSTDAKIMMEATKKDWDKKSNDGSFVPSHEWSGTKLRFKNPNGTNGAYQDLQGPAGSIENATAKDIKTASGSNVETELSAVKDMTSIVNLTLNANYPLVSSGNLNRVTIPFNVIVYNKPYGVGVSKHSDGVIKVEKDGVLDINVTLTLNPSSTDSQMLAGYHIYKNGDAIASVYQDPILGKYTPISFGCAIPVGTGDLISVRCSPDASSQFKTIIHKTSNFRCVHHQMNID